MGRSHHGLAYACNTVSTWLLSRVDVITLTGRPD
jgi:hypothetical protein